MGWKQNDQEFDIPPFIIYSGSANITSHLTSGNTNFTSATGVLSASPIIIPRRMPFVAVRIIVSSSASGLLARLGIYNDNVGIPGSLLLDAGEADGSGTGTKTITISQILNPGWYWLAMFTNGVGTFRGLSATFICLGFNTPDDTTIHSGVNATITYGVLPDPFPAFTYNTGAGARVYLGMV